MSSTQGIGKTCLSSKHTEPSCYVGREPSCYVGTEPSCYVGTQNPPAVWAHRTLLLCGHRTLCRGFLSCWSLLSLSLFRYVDKEPSCYVDTEPFFPVDIRRINGSGKTQPFHIQSQENIKVPVCFRLMARAEMHTATHLVLEAEKPMHVNTVNSTGNNTASLEALRIHSSVHSMDLAAHLCTVQKICTWSLKTSRAYSD